MEIVKQRNAVSERDLKAVRNMIARRHTLRQTKCRRIRIWPALGRDSTFHDVAIWREVATKGGKTTKTVALLTVAMDPT